MTTCLLLVITVTTKLDTRLLKLSPTAVPCSGLRARPSSAAARATTICVLSATPPPVVVTEVIVESVEVRAAPPLWVHSTDVIAAQLDPLRTQDTVATLPRLSELVGVITAKDGCHCLEINVIYKSKTYSAKTISNKTYLRSLIPNATFLDYRCYCTYP